MAPGPARPPLRHLIDTVNGLDERQARRMYDARELTVERIGGVLGVSRTSIYRALQRQPGSAAD